MRDILFNKNHEDLLNKVADMYSITTEELWQAYMEMLRSNFEQDLNDIAKDMEKSIK